MKAASLAFDRWDFLATKTLLAVTGIATPVVLLLAPAWRWAQGRPLQWSADIVVNRLAAPTITARPGAELTWDGTARMTIDDPAPSVWVATMLPQAFVALTVVAVIVVLYRLIVRIQSGTAFVMASVRGLRIIALILLAAPWFVLPLGGYADAAVVGTALAGTQINDFALVTGGSLAVMAAGLMIGAIAEAFAQGQRLQDDVDGLV
ncbi:MAG: DUF2975 domain-containing protein [Nocardioides sp.]